MGVYLKAEEKGITEGGRGVRGSGEEVGEKEEEGEEAQLKEEKLWVSMRDYHKCRDVGRMEGREGEGRRRNRGYD